MCTGKNGEDVIIPVPLGCVVLDASNNEVVADSSKGLGGVFNILPTPQKTDYYFAGWFNDSTRYSASSSVQNITLTAKWVPSTGANASAKYILFNTTTDSSGTPKSTLDSAVSDSVSNVSNVILVCDDDSLSTRVNIEGKDITLRSAGDYTINQGAVTITDGFIKLNSYAIFTMYDVILNGRNSSTYTSRGVYVMSSTFNLESGAIKNFYTQYILF